ncbi:histidine ammonia-lyase [Mesorhizobium sp. VNQ89]|uniref:HAL/PAL/TAL family ammonia-lyase n=1 Tax=Mesorhizobium quangtriensis TaxID=3157709 RepID=UPI0032B7F21D
MPDGQIVLDDAPVTPAGVVAVARRNARLVLGDHALRRISDSRSALEAMTSGSRPVYGLNTSLGASVDTPLGGDDMIAFQRRVAPSHSVGVGPLLPTEQVRAMIAARISGAAAGGTGMSVGVISGLVTALNAGIHPLVPAWGSVGAADLAPLAHMARSLMGNGDVEYRGEILPAMEALKRAGLDPLDIREKDGHALVVANSLSTGAACLVLEDIARFIDWSFTAIGLSYEGFRSSLSALDDSGMAARPAFGQREAAARLRLALEGSSLWQEGAARRLQDPLSFRCAPQVWGALLHAYAQAEAATSIELAHSGDNPVILSGEGRAVANGNFDMTAFALTWEQLGQALAHCAVAIVNRSVKQMSPTFSGLPRFLSARGQNYIAYAQLQKTLSALEAEIRHLANPISLSPMPISDWSEDQSSMAPRVVAKTAEIVQRLRYLVAIELMAACTAIELRNVAHSLGPVMGNAFRMVRTHVQPLDDDRALGPDMEALAKMIAGSEAPATRLG